MVLDTSAVFAILVGEPDGDRLQHLIGIATERRMSALTLYECRLVLGSRGGDAMLERLAALLQAAEVQIDPFDEQQAHLAHAAYRRFGPGSGHPARLNFGDCAAYALATSLVLPLLYKGDDFAKTDVAAAL